MPVWELALPVASWLITYLIHSTVLLGGAWCVTRLGLIRGPAGRESLWKAVMVAGLVTASAQVGFTALRNARSSDDPSIWAYRSEAAALDGALDAASADKIRVILRARVDSAGAPADPARGEDLRIAPLPKRRIEARVAEAGAACMEALRGPLPPDERVKAAVGACANGGLRWTEILLAVWTAGALLLLARLARDRWLLRSVLAERSPVPSGEAREVLDELMGASGLRGQVRLSAAPTLESPAVVAHREICLPLRPEDGLTVEELRVVLAHELAHLIRGDLVWGLISRVLSAVLFVQPLNRLAQREIEAEAEFLCDDWAVARTGDPVGLARSLTRVSEWLTTPRRAPLLAMVREGGSPLLRRVKRILDPAGEAHGSSRLRVLVMLVALCLPILLVPPVTLQEKATLLLIPPDGQESPALQFMLDGPNADQASVMFVRTVRAELRPLP